MGVIRETTPDGVSGVEWMATAAFLGVLYCTVLGVFKKFRASLNFNTGATQPTSVEAVSRAVYRPLGDDSFSDNYINQANSSTSMSYPSVNKEEQPKNTKTLPLVKPHASNIHNAQSNLAVNAVSSTANASTSKTDDKIKSGSETTLKGDEKVKMKENKKEKVAVKVENTEKLDKEKLKEKAKKEKEDKLKKEKQEKLKKENDKKLKLKEEKDSKEKKKKGKASSKPVASITIDEEVVASTHAAARNPMSSLQAAPKNPAARIGPSPPSYEEDVFSKNAKNLLGNPNSTQINTPNTEIGEPGGFASSWDQVALHRQNMQKELKPMNAPATNLRAMANWGTRDEKEINNLFLTGASSPRNNNPKPQAITNRRFSDFSSGQESDTEA